MILMHEIACYQGSRSRENCSDIYNHKELIENRKNLLEMMFQT